MTYIDPLVATGYVYKIGAGDPNFASVTAVTKIGNGSYQLLVWDGTQFVLRDGALMAGEMFDFLKDGFDANGVSEFEIIGIDPAGGLSPTNITAFVTGLTFTAEGSFTGTMQPLVTNTAAVRVPSQVRVAGLGAGLGSFSCFAGASGGMGLCDGTGLTVALYLSVKGAASITDSAQDVIPRWSNRPTSSRALGIAVVGIVGGARGC